MKLLQRILVILALASFACLWAGSSAHAKVKGTGKGSLVAGLDLGDPNETKTTTPSAILGPSVPDRVAKAVEAAPKYILQSLGEDSAAHAIAAYEWGYEVGDPAVVEALRTSTEVYQFFFFTAVDRAVRHGTFGLMGGPYQPISIDYLMDSKEDIENAIKGATDKANGLSPNPPN